MHTYTRELDYDFGQAYADGGGCYFADDTF